MHCTTSLDQPSERTQATVALVGQPNVGKSTVFNMLTGLHQHVGNWPGKTVEQRIGTCEHDGLKLAVVDLPGAYSLTAASPEETVTREYLIRSQPDVVLAILNAASLERNLYLVAEVLALTPRVVIGLNMLDVARQEGIDIDPSLLGQAIGVPVVPMVAARSEGVHELIDAAVQAIRHPSASEPMRPTIAADHLRTLADILALIHGHVPQPYPEDWVALKLLEGDSEVTALLRTALPAERWKQVANILRHHEDAFVAVAGGRYAWIRRVANAALRRTRIERVTLSQRLDAVATHPIGGMIALAGVLLVLFGITYAVGGPLQKVLAEQVVGGLAMRARGAPVPRWLASLVADGIIGGVGTVITFLPILLLFFAAMGLLEDVGYMARAAYMMDRFMHAIGLHGKSFMPLFLGFGCNVPAVMGTRIIESPRDRLLTILLVPLVPCTARLAVLAVLVPVFFPSDSTLVAWGLTGLPLAVLALVGVVVRRATLRDETVLIMEMPLYHMPNWRSIGIGVWERLLAFLRKASTVILSVSIVIWALATLPSGDIDSSYLGMVGRALEPVGAWTGLGWRALVALLASFVAKENSVAVLGVLYGAGQDRAALLGTLATQWRAPSGLAFLVAQMLFIPCASTVAAIRQETGSWTWTLVDIAVMALLALLGATVTYQLALRWA